MMGAIKKSPGVSLLFSVLLLNALTACELAPSKTPGKKSDAGAIDSTLEPTSIAQTATQEKEPDATDSSKLASSTEPLGKQPASKVEQPSVKKSTDVKETLRAERRWKKSFQAANNLLSANKQQQALDYARQAEALSRNLDNKAFRYASLIQLSYLEQDSAVFKAAYSNASSKEEKALTSVILGQYSRVKNALGSLDGSSQPYTVAFIHYRYAEKRSDFNAAKEAARLYRQAESYYGVVDSLFLAAQLANDSETANRFASRALRVAEYLPHKQRQRDIARWLSDKK